MGEQRVDAKLTGQQLGRFAAQLLADLRALERMIDEGMIETGIHRIGAEQEVFLIDAAKRPAPISLELLDDLDDAHFTTELGCFNLEINLDPLELEPHCISRMERKVSDHLAQVRQIAHRHDAEVVLTGILPTLRTSDLGPENITPMPRYRALSEALDRLGGGAYEFRLQGVDELFLRHGSVMLEACCTSFQFHLQVAPDEFPLLYNLAQLATAPVLAAATNSPLLFGRRLWMETRIPLFQQGIDTRGSTYHLRERRPRVHFGQAWVRESVLELFREDAARFPVILAAPVDETPSSRLDRGEVPRLEALRVHNGTVYRWNRACYGTHDGTAHLRIEARALPSGPTVVDELANAAFFWGLVFGLRRSDVDPAAELDFEHARVNFRAAAEVGLDARFRWLGNESVPARRLILERLLPLARDGLEDAGIAASDVDRYLGIVEERVEAACTGAHWLLESLSRMDRANRYDAFTALTAATVSRQWDDVPCHRWPLARLQEGRVESPVLLRVEEFMTTDVFAVRDYEPVSLVAHLMDCRNIRHVPVEDADGKLVGLVSCVDVLRHLARAAASSVAEPTPVSEIMATKPVTVPLDMPMQAALALLQRQATGCLPVVLDERLVGIVTEHDFVDLVARFVEQEAAAR